MNASPEYASFARLVESQRPWLDQIVVVGGWAHRLHRLHQQRCAMTATGPVHHRNVSLGCFNANVISTDPGTSVACGFKESQSL